MKKLISLVLVFTLLFCASPFAYAAEIETEQEQSEEELQKIFLDSPPFGSASDYNENVHSSNGSVFFTTALRTVSAYSIGVALIASGCPSIFTVLDFGDMLFSSFGWMLSNPSYDQYANNTSLYYVHEEWSGPWAEAKKIVRKYYFSSARTAASYVDTVVYYAYWM